MALFVQSLFPDPFDLPVGVVGTPTGTNDPIVLQLGDGTQVTVFDKLTTALRLLAYMRRNAQWNVQGSDDVMVVSINAVKGMVLENNLVNHKLVTSFLPTYIGDQVRFVHRSMSTVVSLTDALRSVGFCHTSSLPFSNNLDLRLGGTCIQLFDWNYVALPASTSVGSLLEDGSPLRYDFTSS